MQRYFAKEKNDTNFTLYESDLHHIKNVMRYNIGDKIEVVFDKKVYVCEITSIIPLNLKIINESNIDNEMNVYLTVGISLVNEQKMDLILQKLTELGVARIIPIKTERSIVKLDDNKSVKKIIRWQTICKEASEQSKRNVVPVVDNIISLKKLKDIEFHNKYFCSLTGNPKTIKEYISSDINEAIFVIGPEGGFTAKEEKELIEDGFLPVTLGKRVMRVETAAIYVASVINYICEE